MKLSLFFRVCFGKRVTKEKVYDESEMMWFMVKADEIAIVNEKTSDLIESYNIIVENILSTSIFGIYVWFFTLFTANTQQPFSFLKTSFIIFQNSIRPF